ncbi:MAG: asparagine--tRNA ligase [Xanthomonadales bacterium]|jgi:asparaginyl-tRNA synthetase|nr:asparagine--tRNA ligase [Xanthomonadales bacterium]
MWISVKQALAADPGAESITVKGWVRTRRDSKAGISFIQLNDGSCFGSLQIVAPATLPNYADAILKLGAGCAIEATGTLVASQGKGQRVELAADSIVLVGDVDDPETYPLQPKQHSYEYLREVAHLRPRSNTFGAVTRVRHCLAQAVHRFFHERGFYWIATPIITASDCEGAGQLFRVSTLDQVNLPRTEAGAIDYSKDFFGKESFLTVSGQLNVETYCLALSKVYTFGPTFRAENSNTTRHLAEFWMIEPEIAFADLNGDADLAEQLLQYVLKAVLEECPEDMAFFADRVEKTAISRLESFLTQAFERIDYSEAIEILKRAKRKFSFPVDWGQDLQTEHERYLVEEHVGRPVVVMNYPEQIKAFYMRLNEDGRTVAAMDVLAPGIGEIIGGSQREERLDLLDQRMRQFGIEPAHYQWYRDLRRYGSVPHAGFGLGFERLVAYVTGMANIRDVIPFPRTPGQVSF